MCVKSWDGGEGVVGDSLILPPLYHIYCFKTYRVIFICVVGKVVFRP